MNSEAYLIGALLIAEGAIKAVRGIVERSDFLSEVYGDIFAAVAELDAESKPVDPVAIRDRVKRNGREVPHQLFAELMDCTPTAANCVIYAQRVAEDARQRRIRELAESIAGDHASTSDELLAKMHREAERIRGQSFTRGIIAPPEALKRFVAHVSEAGKGRQNFVPSGFHYLDEILGGGFLRGGLYILGARPAVGKTAFAINLADNMPGNCLLVSLEMTPEQITSRRISRFTGITSSKMTTGRVTEGDWERIMEAGNTIRRQGVFMNDRYDLTTQQIQLLAQSVPQLQAVIVDYMGLIQAAEKGGSSYENMSKISRELKRMALTLGVPVICLCQLSRAAEKREDKRPLLSDLRDSGAIEQDADAVMFLYREDYYTGAVDSQVSPVELNVAKNRHGKTGRLSFYARLSISAFQEVG
jgi:replicative DNA helicase